VALAVRQRRPLLTWPGRLATKANRAQAADFGSLNNNAYSTVSPHYNDYASYLRAFKEVPYVRPCVSVIAFSAANVKYALVKAGKSNEDSTEDGITASPLLDLLAKPNPYQTGFELREMMFTDLELTGNCFISLEAQDGRGLPSELYRLQPDHVTILGDPRTGIRGYMYTANGKTIPYAPTEIWHQKLPHPFDPLYGMGTIEAMETRADSAKAMSEHEARFWQSGAKITGVLSTDGQVDQTIWDRLKASYRDFLRNSGFSTLILEQGLKYQPVSEGLHTLGLLEIHHMSRDEILTMFGVPPTKVGIIESANYKAQAADQYFWQECIDPKLTRNEQAMQSLVDLFHPGQNLVLRYERLNFDDDAAQADVAQGMQKTYSFTVNELREYQGKDPLPMGDVILIAGRGAPIAIDPQTGEATILGGPTPGEVTVDEGGIVPPTVEAGGGIAPAKPRIHLAPVAKPPTPAVLVAPPQAAPPMVGKSVDTTVARRLALVKADAERRALAVHKPALVQAFSAQEQRIKDALKQESQ
jgi:HK97 family phage portal protein